jgi:hypothetical protein
MINPGEPVLKNFGRLNPLQGICPGRNPEERDSLGISTLKGLNLEFERM